MPSVQAYQLLAFPGHRLMLPCSLYYLSISCPRLSVRSQQAPSCYAVLIILESHIFARCGRLRYVGKTRCYNASEQNGFTEWIHRTASLAYNACAQLLSQHASKKKLAINATPLWNLGKCSKLHGHHKLSECCTNSEEFPPAKIR